jgi:hypothetical protein
MYNTLLVLSGQYQRMGFSVLEKLSFTKIS